MNVKRLLSIALSACLFSQGSWANASTVRSVSFEYNSLIFSRVWSSYEQNENVFQFFRSTGARLSPADKVFFEQQAKKIRHWPAITYANNEIIIQAKPKVIIKAVDLTRHHFQINGRDVFYRAGVPIELQIRNALEASEKLPQPNIWLSLFINRAYALGPLGILGLAKGGAEGTAEVGADMATGGAMITTATIGAIVLGAISLAGASYCAITSTDDPNNKFSHDFLNCLSKPLSWVDLNPRDHLYISNLNCNGDNLSLWLESKTGIHQTLSFDSKNNGINRITSDTYKIGQKDNTFTVIFNPLSHRAEKIKKNGQEDSQARILSSTSEIERYDRLAQDYEYYRGVCRDPARLKAFNAELNQGQKLDTNARPNLQESTK